MKVDNEVLILNCFLLFIIYLMSICFTVIAGSSTLFIIRARISIYSIIHMIQSAAFAASFATFFFCSVCFLLFHHMSFPSASVIAAHFALSIV
jgi:hypothetical protein